MATDSGLLACWQVIQAAGIARPWADKAEADRAIAAWGLVLADVPDERLLVLTAAWLRSAEVRYGRWPMPGALLHALGDEANVDDADEAWSEVLRLLEWRGRDNAPSTPEQLEDLRSRLRASFQLAREANDTDRMARIERIGRALPRPDEARTAALFAGVAACGGWRALGMAEEDAMVAHRAAFRACYRGHRQRRQLTEGERKVAALLDDRPGPKLLVGGQ